MGVTKKKLQEAMMETYRRMFKEATPSADLEELMRTRVTTVENWFMTYYLDQERQEEILAEVAKEYKLTKYDKETLSINVFLGCAPRMMEKYPV